MRTDSTSLSADALAEIEKTVKAEYDAEKHCRRQFKSKSKNAQEAHEAIRPTKTSVAQAGQTAPEKKLYQLIRERTLACQMVEAKILRTKIIAGNKDLPPFEATGSVIKEDGWLIADPGARGEENVLPAVKEDETLELISIESIGKETQPPKRFTEAGLIKELEKRGIGRPSTYAPIIKTLHDRLYVERENRTLRPTDTGEVVNDFLSEHFNDYISDSFTAHMEDELDKIASGQRTYVKALTDFYRPFKKAIADKKSLPKITNLGEAPQDIICPKCGGPMIYKLAKTGKFFSCAKFPDCDGARTLDGNELKGPKDTGELCPKCGKANLVEREGRFGKFIACGRYPKCRYVKKDENNKNGDTGITCPVCKKGTMVAKRGRYGTFWACSRYPDCRHTIKSKPTGKICGYPRDTGPCPHLLMAGTKTIPERCSDKTCPNHRPDKINKK
jgi:DNA topoisomerase I